MKLWLIAVLAAAAVGGVGMWGAGRYEAGAGAVHAEYKSIIEQSGKLTRNEKDAALAAASDAARLVCEREGLPAADCQDL